MRLGDVSRALVGATVVYVAMAACSASDDKQVMRLQMVPDGGQAGHEGSIGAGGTEGGTEAGGDGSGGELGDAMADAHADVHADGFLDALTDPVPDALADSPPVNGSRLKAKVRVADDGAREKIPGVWFDSQLGVDCSFATATDGIERCLPIVGEKARGVSTVGFIDAGCTQRYVPPPKPECPQVVPTYGFEAKQLDCGSGFIVYALGPLTTVPKVYTGSPAACSEWPGSTSTQVYPSTGEVAPATFVAAHAEVEP